MAFISLGPTDTRGHRFLWGLCYHVVRIRLFPDQNKQTEGKDKRKQGKKVAKNCLPQVFGTEGGKRAVDAQLFFPALPGDGFCLRS